MQDDDFGVELFKSFEQQWIMPELTRRFGGSIPSTFKISRCLVRMPTGKPPIVEFNEEFRFVAEIEMRDGGSWAENDDVFLHDIKKIRRVQPIAYDGKRVPFILLLSSHGLWSILFDADPEADDLDSTPWRFSDWLARYLEDRATARVAVYDAQGLARLQSIGLWPAPSLLPYPLSEIAKLLEDGKPIEAEASLTRHCTAGFIKGLVSAWKSVKVFSDRSALFDSALAAHERGEYALSVYALIPHVEGVMADWLHGQTGSLPRNIDKRAKAVFALVNKAPRLTPTGTKMVNGAIDFIQQGPLLQSFHNWSDPLPKAFPSRHALLHGRFDPAFLTEASSIKAFLLLDTLWHMLNARTMP